MPLLCFKAHHVIIIGDVQSVDYLRTWTYFKRSYSRNIENLELFLYYKIRICSYNVKQIWERNAKGLYHDFGWNIACDVDPV